MKRKGWAAMAAFLVGGAFAIYYGISRHVLAADVFGALCAFALGFILGARVSVWAIGGRR